MNSGNTKEKRPYTPPQIRKLPPDAAAAMTPAILPANAFPEDFRLKALIATPDARMKEIMSSCFQELGIAVQPCGDAPTALDQLASGKFEALVLDFDAEAVNTITSVRTSRANKTAVIFAVASNPEARQNAFEHGTSFVFERPLVPSKISQVLRTAYGLMLRDRREYFRLSAEFPVLLQKDSTTGIECRAINISRNGMAVQAPFPVRVGEIFHVHFQPDSGINVLGTGTVIWTDQHGKMGLAMEYATADAQAAFSAWMDDQFYTRFDIQLPAPQ